LNNAVDIEALDEELRRTAQVGTGQRQTGTGVTEGRYGMVIFVRTLKIGGW